MFWLSQQTANDQFALYVFDAGARADAIDEVRRRSRDCDALQVRIRDDNRWTFPAWEHCDIADEQFVVHDAAPWPQCLEIVTGIDQLDATKAAWRVHLIPADDRSAVVVQMSHALADGARGAMLAGALLGRRGIIPPQGADDRGSLLWRSVAAVRTHRQLQRDTAAGLVPPPQPPRPVLSVNAAPSGRREMRTLVLRRDQLPGPTVTVATAVAISEALGGYLVERGEDISSLGAEVPMAHSTTSGANNNFRNVGVGLYPNVGRGERGSRIASDLTAQRRRGEHPAMRAAAAAFAASPAPVLRWGARQFDPTARTPMVTGNTVVSSVNRGAADLSFGGAAVLFTAGYPALSPMMSLTHGVHGIGDAVAVSVHADTGNVDVDGYVDRLRHALGLRM